MNVEVSCDERSPPAREDLMEKETLSPRLHWIIQWVFFLRAIADLIIRFKKKSEGFAELNRAVLVLRRSVANHSRCTWL